MIFVSGLGTGYAPVASGTFGTLPGVILYYFLQPWNSPGPLLAGYVAVVLVLFWAGCLASSAAERITGRKDSGRIVIDEIVGFLVTMFLVAGRSWQILVVGFLAFRFFDVVKLYPANRLQSIRGGFGVMIDDIVAGIYACLGVHAWVLLCEAQGWAWAGI